MYAISAADCISPAMERTRTLLFRPFSWGTYLKLCLVATITGGGGGGNFRSARNWGNSTGNRTGNFPNFHFTPPMIAVMLCVVVVLLILGFVIAYLVTRLRFAYFHCLVHNLREITPGWRIYKEQATRFFWMSVGIGFGFLLLILLIAIPFAAGFLRLIRDTPAGGPPDWGVLFSLLLPLIPIILVLALVGFGIQVILRDFVLPQYALENATAGQAWGAAWARIAAEKGAFFVYALLRVVLPLGAGIAMLVILVLPGILFFGVTVGIEVALHAAFAEATGAGLVMGFVLKFLVGAIAFLVAFFVWICFAGPVSTFIRQFALLFYGGRYPALGAILYPPPITPVMPTAPYLPGIG
jgi:hypothetical protein